MLITGEKMIKITILLRYMWKTHWQVGEKSGNFVIHVDCRWLLHTNTKSFGRWDSESFVFARVSHTYLTLQRVESNFLVKATNIGNTSMLPIYFHAQSYNGGSNEYNFWKEFLQFESACHTERRDRRIKRQNGQLSAMDTFKSNGNLYFKLKMRRFIWNFWKILWYGL